MAGSDTNRTAIVSREGFCNLFRDRQCLVDWSWALVQFGRRASGPRPVP